MHSDDHPGVLIRPMVQAERATVANLIVSAGNFSQPEMDCALEPVDIYLTPETFDLYWIATRPDSRGHGFGRALMTYVENKALERNGRLLAVETSSKASNASTVEFCRRLGYAETSRIRDFCDVGDDKFIFVKKLS